jgi:hypothetical protein
MMIVALISTLAGAAWAQDFKGVQPHMTVSTDGQTCPDGNKDCVYKIGSHYVVRDRSGRYNQFNIGCIQVGTPPQPEAYNCGGPNGYRAVFTHDDSGHLVGVAHVPRVAPRK